VAPGERVAVLGRNGSGKTTLVRVLATDLVPTGGRLRLLGEAVPPASPALRRGMGVALDRPAHLESLSGRRNALLFGRAAGLSSRDAASRVAPLFDRFALTEAADVPVAAYSLGMRRKLLLVEALLHRPRLIVLDEPTLGLDPAGIAALVEALSAAAAPPAGEGAGVVTATNDPVSAARLADRVVFLDGGRVVADASPEALVARAGAETRCTVELEEGASSTPAPLARLAGLAGLPGPAGLPGLADITLEAIPGGIEARMAGGAAGLPRLVAALVEAGQSIRSIRVREADLGDAYRLLTGRSLRGDDPEEEA
jgi:ABC-2 type transport system ATP-binding protein